MSDGYDSKAVDKSLNDNWNDISCPVLRPLLYKICSLLDGGIDPPLRMYIWTACTWKCMIWIVSTQVMELCQRVLYFCHTVQERVKDIVIQVGWTWGWGGSCHWWCDAAGCGRETGWSIASISNAHILSCLIHLVTRCRRQHLHDEWVTNIQGWIWLYNALLDSHT